MTIERTIKAHAVELAGAFYEKTRTDKFRRAYPTFNHFKQGWQVMYDQRGNVIDGPCKKVKPGWLYFIDIARKTLTLMLGQPNARISPAMKERIYDAIIEDRNNTTSRKPTKVHQRMTLDG